jgi:predicted N-acetyltransferase YhbS
VERFLNIRPSTHSDREALCRVHRDAFGAGEGPEIADLVSGLLEDETARPYLSLVAESDRGVVGHVLFTAVRVHSLGCDPSARILAPLAVAQGFQRQGVGGLLTREGLKQLDECGVELVFVLGHPSYYPRFGFQPAGVLGLEAPYPISDENVDAWMVKELKIGVIQRTQGRVECSSVLSHPKYWIE